MYFFAAHWNNWFQVFPTLWVETGVDGSDCPHCAPGETGIEIGLGWLVFAVGVYIPTHSDE